MRRVTDSWRVPCGEEASQVHIGMEMLRSLPINTFMAINTSAYWVRLKGSSSEFTPVEDWKGWVIAPGQTIEHETQYPEWVSGIAIERPGFMFDPETPFGELELQYGYVER